MSLIARTVPRLGCPRRTSRAEARKKCEFRYFRLLFFIMAKRRRVQDISIVKVSGATEPFSEEKLRESLLRSAAPVEVIEDVIQAVRKQLHPGMTTKELYRLTHNELKHAARPVAAKYGLRKAIMDLGPTGLPF